MIADGGERSPGATLMFRDLSYSVRSADGRKYILNKISGLVTPGQCCAILGSSGSGKTTLLDILAGQTSDGIEGIVSLNGERASSDYLRLNTGYVMQDDRLLPNLSVRETLLYSARLRLPSSLSSAEMSDRVSATIASLGLRHVADRRVGGTFRRGLSGGEKRRVSIGLQLLSQPHVLFLDEPTTGLDSFTAHSIVQMLRSLSADQGRTIVFTVHQPRSDIFELLDVMMLMSQGECVYFGTAQGVVPYFESIGFPCDAYASPLDHYIDVVSIDKRSERVQRDTLKRLVSLVASYHASAPFAALQDSMDAHGKDDPLPLAKRDPPGMLSAFGTLYARMMKNMARDPSAIFDRTMQLGMFGLIMLAYIISLGLEQSSVQNRTGFLFESVSCAMFIGMLNSLALFPEHRDLFFRERRDESYNSFTLMLAYLAHMLPTSLIAATVFLLITYFQLGLQTGAAHIFSFWGVMVLLHIWGELLGVLMLGLFFDMNLANSMGSLAISILAMLGSGFLRSVESMPPFFSTLSYVSVAKYSSELVVVNEFEGLVFNCRESDQVCRYPTGNFYLELIYPGADERHVLNWAMTAVMVAFVFIGAAIALRFKLKLLN